MRTTIKNKTQLREEIKASIGNTGSLDKIEFYADYTWSRMSSSTFSDNCVERVSISALALDENSYTSSDYDSAITLSFLQIELKISRLEN